MLVVAYNFAVVASVAVLNFYERMLLEPGLRFLWWRVMLCLPFLCWR